jgi:hypothetical protein
MSIKARKALNVVLSLVTCISMAAMAGGCATKTVATATPATTQSAASEATATPEAATKAPAENVTIRFSQFGNSLDDAEGMKNDRIKAAIEKKLNITLQYDSGTDGYDDRIALELSSGTAPDLFPTWGEAEKLSKWAADGAVTKLSDVVSKDTARYPILNTMFTSTEYKNYNKFYTGNENDVYAIYSIASFDVPAFSGVPVYNTKILKECGLSDAPKTVDEFVAFTKKAASLGIAGWWPRNDKLTNWLEIDRTIASPNGTAIMPPNSDFNGFLPSADGTWTLMTTSDKSKDVVKTLADMYKANALSQGVGTKGDFDDAYADFGSGKLACVNFGFGYPGQFRDFYKDPWLKANPNAKISDLTLGYALQGSAGYSKNYSASYWVGAHYFVPASCKTPDRVLDLVEFLASADGQALVQYGIEGTHYTKAADGSITYTPAEWTKEDKPYGYDDGRCKYVWFTYLFSGTEYMTEIQTKGWFQSVTHPIDNSHYWATDVDNELMNYAKPRVASYSGDVVVNEPMYFTMVKVPDKFVDIRKKLVEITNRYLPAMIGGQMDIDKEWPNYVKEYEEAGAKDLQTAINEALTTAKATYGN